MTCYRSFFVFIWFLLLPIHKNVDSDAVTLNVVQFKETVLLSGQSQCCNFKSSLPFCPVIWKSYIKVTKSTCPTPTGGWGHYKAEKFSFKLNLHHCDATCYYIYKWNNTVNIRITLSTNTGNREKQAKQVYHVTMGGSLAPSKVKQ